MTINYPSACLNKYAYVQGGFAFKSSDFKDFGVPVLKIKNVRIREIDTSELDFVSQKVAGNATRYYCKHGDLLISMTGSGPQAPASVVGRVARFTGPDNKYLINQRVGRLIIKDQNHLNPRYLFYILTRPEYHWKLVSTATGSANQANISSDQIESLEIPIPPFMEQCAISQFIGALDDKIELNRKMNETLEGIVQAIFQSWFIDFDPVRAKMEGRKPSGMDAATAALFPDSFEDLELGEIPKGWKVQKIKELTSNIQYGLTQSASQEPVGPHFLRITDIQGGHVNWRKVPYCSVSKGDEERYKLRRGDVLVARTGASTGENIYLSDVPEAVFASYLVRFQFDQPAMARLVGAFMRTAEYFNYIAGCLGGSAQPNASAQVLASASLTVPPLTIAKTFFDIIDPLDKKISANNNESGVLASLRDTLLPKLLNGDLRVGREETKAVSNG